MNKFIVIIMLSCISIIVISLMFNQYFAHASMAYDISKISELDIHFGFDCIIPDRSKDIPNRLRNIRITLNKIISDQKKLSKNISKEESKQTQELIELNNGILNAKNACSRYGSALRDY